MLCIPAKVAQNSDTNLPLQSRYSLDNVQNLVYILSGQRPLRRVLAHLFPAPCDTLWRIPVHIDQGPETLKIDKNFLGVLAFR